MADPKEKNWWERNVEDSWEESAKREHNMFEGNPVAQAQSDIGYGMQRGAYEFGKGLALGLVDLAKLTYNLKTGDPETIEKTWNITKKIAKEAYIAEFGSPAEQRDQNERAWAAMSGVGKHVKEEMGKQWDQAAREGRQAALVSRWVTEGVLNIAAFFVGAEEVKAAASAAKTAEALEGAEAATVVIKCPKALAAEQAANAKKFAEWEAAQKAATAAQATEAAKVADVVKPEMSPYGDLTAEELAKLKSIAAKNNAPIDVVGSTAKGTRRGVGTDLPLGKGKGTKSDLDIRMDGEIDVRTSGRASDNVYDEFPKGKDVDRILNGDPHPGAPRITVNPDGTVETHNGVPLRDKP